MVGLLLLYVEVAKARYMTPYLLVACGRFLGLMKTCIFCFSSFVLRQEREVTQSVIALLQVAL